MSAEDRIDAALDRLLDGVPDIDPHAEWIIDQVVRILTGCPEVQKCAPGYPNGTVMYTELGESKEYKQFVAEYEAGEDGPHTYTWGTGTAP